MVSKLTGFIPTRRIVVGQRLFKIEMHAAFHKIPSSMVVKWLTDIIWENVIDVLKKCLKCAKVFKRCVDKDSRSWFY